MALKRELLPAANNGWDYLVSSAKDNAELKNFLVKCQGEYKEVLRLYNDFTQQVDHLSTCGDFGSAHSVYMKGFAWIGCKGQAKRYVTKLNRISSKTKKPSYYLVEKIDDVMKKCRKESQVAAQHSTTSQIRSWVSGCSLLSALVAVLTNPVAGFFAAATVTFVAGISFLSELQFQEDKQDFKDLEKTFRVLYSLLQALHSRAITLRDKINDIEKDSQDVIDTIDQGTFNSDDLDTLRTRSRDLQRLLNDENQILD